MSLSKQQMIGAVGGGLFALGVLGLGWFLYSAWSEKGEAEEQLTSETDAFGRFTSAAVYPSKASIDSVKSNATSFAQWYDSAVALAARGDKVFATETSSIFKKRLEGEVRRLLNLAGGVNGKIAAPSFLFGFEQFLGEGGVLPKEEEVPRLAVQLDAISSFVGAFAEAGVFEVKSIVRVEAKEEKAEGEEQEKKKASTAKQAKAASNEPKTTKMTYQFEIAAHPEALVKTLNTLTSSARFAVVRNLSFKTAADTIVDRLAAAEKAKADEGAAKSAPRRRRGAAAQTFENPAAAAAASRIVSDPLGDEPITMTFTLDVYDFGRKAAEVAAAAAAAAAAPAEAKAETEKPAEKPAEKEENKQ